MSVLLVVKKNLFNCIACLMLSRALHGIHYLSVLHNTDASTFSLWCRSISLHKAAFRVCSNSTCSVIPSVTAPDGSNSPYFESLWGQLSHMAMASPRVRLSFLSGCISELYLPSSPPLSPDPPFTPQLWHLAYDFGQDLQQGWLWSKLLFKTCSVWFLVLDSACCSAAKFCLTLCDPVDCSTTGSPVLAASWSLLKLMSIELVMPSDHLILCRALMLEKTEGRRRRGRQRMTVFT